MDDISYEKLKQALIEQNKRAAEGKLDPELDSVVIEFLKMLNNVTPVSKS